MKVSTILLVCFLLGGCVKYVDVPVWVCPSPTFPVKEELKSLKLTKDANTDTILRSLVYDLYSTKLYSEQLEVLLRGYAREKVQVFK